MINRRGRGAWAPGGKTTSHVGKLYCPTLIEEKYAGLCFTLEVVAVAAMVRVWGPPPPPPSSEERGKSNILFIRCLHNSAVAQQMGGGVIEKTIYFKRSSLVKRWLKYTVRMEDCSYLRLKSMCEEGFLQTHFAATCRITWRMVRSGSRCLAEDFRGCFHLSSMGRKVGWTLQRRCRPIWRLYVWRSLLYEDIKKYSAFLPQASGHVEIPVSPQIQANFIIIWSGFTQCISLHSTGQMFASKLPQTTCVLLAVFGILAGCKGICFISFCQVDFR